MGRLHNQKLILIVEKTKRGKKGKVDLGTSEAILDAYHTQQTTTATSNKNNIPNNSIAEGQEEGGKQNAGVRADKDTAGKSEPHYHKVWLCDHLMDDH